MILIGPILRTRDCRLSGADIYITLSSTRCLNFPVESPSQYSEEVLFFSVWIPEYIAEPFFSVLLGQHTEHHNVDLTWLNRKHLEICPVCQ